MKKHILIVCCFICLSLMAQAQIDSAFFSKGKSQTVFEVSKEQLALLGKTFVGKNFALRYAANGRTLSPAENMHASMSKGALSTIADDPAVSSLAIGLSFGFQKSHVLHKNVEYYGGLDLGLGYETTEGSFSEFDNTTWTITYIDYSALKFQVNGIAGINYYLNQRLALGIVYTMPISYTMALSNSLLSTGTATNGNVYSTHYNEQSGWYASFPGMLSLGATLTFDKK